MKYRFLVILPLLLLAGCANPPASPDAIEKLSSEEAAKANPDLLGGLMYVYDYKAEPALTPAPKGYKPFYVSHYGRHGARYATNVQYKMVKKALDKAKEAGALTEAGEKWLDEYSPFYEEAIYHDGELTGIGIEQKKTIAIRLASRFPEVFEGETHAAAISTPVHRVILSMAAFIDGLQSVDKSFTADESYSESYSPILRPNFSPLSKGRPDNMDKMVAPYIDYFRETVDIKGIMGRIFVNPEEAVKAFGIDDILFIRHLSDIVNGLGCISGQQTLFDGVFTEQDRIDVARAAWYRLHLFLTRYKDSASLFPDYSAYTLKDIVDKTEEDIASGKVQIRLRFSHDSAVIPLLALMNIDGLGEVAETPQEAFDIFPMWEMPMGGSLQMIFYRDRRGKDVLVKLLRNEKEAAIPITPVEGPYYRWSDVKEYCDNRIGSSLAKIEMLVNNANN